MRYAAIFDLDGTLVDTPGAILEGFAAAFARMGVGPREPTAIAATIGLPLEQAFSTLLGVPLDDERVALGVHEYRVEFQESILPRAGALVFPGVAEGLAALNGAGIALAVATSKFRASADAMLTAAGLLGWLDVVVGADQVSRGKPHPEMAETALRGLDVPAERAVLIGDTTHDLLMARAAGLRSIAVTYGVHGEAELLTAHPTWVVHTFDQVVRRIETFGSGGDGDVEHERNDDPVQPGRAAAG